MLHLRYGRADRTALSRAPSWRTTAGAAGRPTPTSTRPSEVEGASAEVVVAPGRTAATGSGAPLVAALRPPPDRPAAALGARRTSRRRATSPPPTASPACASCWQMRRPLARALPLAPVSLPDGFAARTFEPGRDEQAWLAVNAAAFATTPSRGG